LAATTAVVAVVVPPAGRLTLSTTVTGDTGTYWPASGAAAAGVIRMAARDHSPPRAGFAIGQLAVSPLRAGRPPDDTGG
jgi:hypothetical protein